MKDHINCIQSADQKLMKQLSIVLPCYNPPTGWEKHVYDAYLGIKQELGFEPEIIVVDDGSQGSQEEALLFLKDRIPDFRTVGYPENKGKGAALRFGVNIAKSTKIIYTDIDFPYTIASFLKIWKALELNNIAVGTKDESYYQHLPKARIRISRFLRKMISISFRMPITDTQCGLKGFDRKGAAVFLNTTIDRYLCDLEFVYKAFRMKPKLNIFPVKVTLRNEVEFRKMNIRVLSSEFFNFIKILKG